MLIVTQRVQLYKNRAKRYQMIIIPARVESTRFPKKVLADVGGVPMVVATAKRVEAVSKVVIATDSSEVKEAVERYGYEAVITSKKHQSGTDRIDEAAEILGVEDDEVVVNVQADEPFIEEEVVRRVYEEVLNGKEALVYSCCKRISKESAKDPNMVKVITDVEGYAIYFSRSIIPFDRDGEFDGYFGHLGIYGFRRGDLREFCTLSSSPLEKIEKLEQLRALYHGKKISMVEVESQSFGIDTKEDLQKALEKLR
jgi:3-deoxy-manno-octulosonate cytidylyltransferase (CMP-KDO synthetase)